MRMDAKLRRGGMLALVLMLGTTVATAQSRSGAGGGSLLPDGGSTRDLTAPGVGGVAGTGLGGSGGKAGTGGSVPGPAGQGIDGQGISRDLGSAGIRPSAGAGGAAGDGASGSVK